jgi:hypothetical protein
LFDKHQEQQEIMRVLAATFRWLRGTSDEAADYRARVVTKVKACFYRKRASAASAKRKRLAEKAEHKRERRERRRGKKRAKKNPKQPQAEPDGEEPGEEQ